MSEEKQEYLLKEETEEKQETSTSLSNSTKKASTPKQTPKPKLPNSLWVVFCQRQGQHSKPVESFLSESEMLKHYSLKKDGEKYKDTDCHGNGIVAIKVKLNS